jgi:hypothetical protein
MKKKKKENFGRRSLHFFLFLLLYRVKISFALTKKYKVENSICVAIKMKWFDLILIRLFRYYTRWGGSELVFVCVCVFMDNLSSQVRVEFVIVILTL